MTALIRWISIQGASRVSTWVASHPGESTLIAAGLANPATRGIVWDTLKSLGWRSAQFAGRVGADVGVSAVARSSKASWLWSQTQKLGRMAARHPVVTTAVVYATLATASIALAQDEDPRTQQSQTRAVSQGIGGTGQPGIGSWSW